MSLINTVLIGLRNHPESVMRESLVYIANEIEEEDGKYYTGFIFNRKAARSVIQSVVDNYPGINSSRIYYGGGIATHRAALFIHDFDHVCSSEHGRIYLDSESPIGLTTGIEPWKDIVEGCGPEPYKLILGYSQWDKETLDFQVDGIGIDSTGTSIYEGNPVWVKIPPDYDTIMSTSDDWKTQWERAIDIYSKLKVSRLAQTD